MKTDDLTKMTEVSDPLVLLMRWLDEAKGAGLPDPDAAALATATPDGVPSVRYVLLRGVRPELRRVRFFTNYESRKGHELEANPRAALALYWAEFGRQVRIEGAVARLPADESDEYFQARPRGHQIGALASPQSRPIASFEELRTRAQVLAEQFADRPIPRPPHWGGFALTAERVEIWIARPDRLHERSLFGWGAHTWQQSLLAP
jgi:pyridoxamine 5'-phosphate oxidase